MKKVSAAIVEVVTDRDGYNAVFPDSEILAGAELIAVPGQVAYWPKPSSHATQVARIMCGDWAKSRGRVDKVYAYEATNFTGKGMIGGGKLWLPIGSWPPPTEGYQWPIAPSFQVANFSWGGADILWMEQIMKLHDYWVDRYNVISCIGCPNLPEEQKQAGIYAYLMSGCQNALRVGSTDQPNLPIPGYPPNILANDWSSYATPKVSDASILLVSLCFERGYAYGRAQLQSIILDAANRDAGQDIDGKRVPALDTDAAASRLKKFLDGEFVPAPQPIPDPIPEPQPPEDMPAFNDSFLLASGKLGLVPNDTFASLTLPEQEDVSDNYDPMTGIYTVPEDGRYECISKIRLADNQAPGLSYGQGVDVANMDSPSFLWESVGPAAPDGTGRTGSINIREAYFKKGDKLRLVTYADATGPIEYLWGELIIRRTA